MPENERCEYPRHCEFPVKKVYVDGRSRRSERRRCHAHTSISRIRQRGSSINKSPSIRRGNRCPRARMTCAMPIAGGWLPAPFQVKSRYRAIRAISVPERHAARTRLYWPSSALAAFCRQGMGIYLGADGAVPGLVIGENTFHDGTTPFSRPLCAALPFGRGADFVT